MIEQNMTSPFGEVMLTNFPPGGDPTHRAWDGGDHYILDKLFENKVVIQGSILLVNDQFGALSCSLAMYDCHHIQDSYQSILAIRNNLGANGLKDDFKTVENSTYSVVLIKIPKTLSLLEYQLRKIRPLVDKTTLIIAGGMTKHIHKSTIMCFESLIGRSPTSLAKKKARLILPELDSELSPPPWKEFVEYSIPFSERTLLNGPHLFSQNHLDRGTALLLEELPSIRKDPKRIADFGCGNGVLSIAAALRYKTSRIFAVDDSLQAVKSCKLNAERFELTERITALHGCDLTGVDGPLDLILSNPPFHQGQRIDMTPSLRFFKQAKEQLVPGGELRIVANRHLGYHSHLNRIFGNCKILRDSHGFLILSSIFKH